MARAFIKFSRGAIAEMAHQDFTAEIEILFYVFGIVFIELPFAMFFEIGFYLLAKDLRERI